MVMTLANPGSVLRALIVVIVLLALSIGVASALGSGLAFLGLVLWLLSIGVVAAGVLAIVRGRPIAGAGAIVAVVAVWCAFQYTLPAILWTVLLLVAIGLVVYGTREDTASPRAWPLLLVRAGIGWALIDNSQDHFRSNWLPAVQGTGFFQTANGTASRPPMWFLDPLYQGFVRDVVVPQVDVWSALVICGELSFGLLLALGLLTPVGALGAMWLNGNYMLMKGFVAHGAYTDKVFFLGEAFSLVTAAGLVYGLDASLRRMVPPVVAEWLMGASAAELPLPSPIQPEPRPI
ncbi:MAG TPA: TQO small subunit DoxD [Chloroflexota bacterium]|nr:TQO small subunit DoxD [Chloroflexota bacterium]